MKIMSKVSELVKTKKKVCAKNSVGFRPKSMRRPKKRSSPKIQWVLAENVDGDPMN